MYYQARLVHLEKYLSIKTDLLLQVRKCFTKASFSINLYFTYYNINIHSGLVMKEDLTEEMGGRGARGGLHSLKLFDMVLLLLWKGWNLSFRARFSCLI